MIPRSPPIAVQCVKFTLARGGISVRAVSRAAHMILSVEDDGGGIAEADLQNLGYPFVQAHNGCAPGKSTQDRNHRDGRAADPRREMSAATRISAPPRGSPNRHVARPREFDPCTPGHIALKHKKLGGESRLLIWCPHKSGRETK